MSTMFEQSVCLLTNGQVALDGVEQSLRASVFEPLRHPKPADPEVTYMGPHLIVPFRPEMGATAWVDVVDRTWPDEMGDQQRDLLTYKLWSMGDFGPHVHPWGLKRALQHTWNSPECRELAPKHTSFVRFRIHYSRGAETRRDPAAELQFLGLLAGACLDLPGVLCFFDPSGETLYTPTRFNEIRRQAMMASITPLPLWANVRMFRLTDQFIVMDTVGNEQLGVSDFEAVFAAAEEQPLAVSNYLRNLTLHVLGLGRLLENGEAIDGPGEENASWTVERGRPGVMLPAREVIRVYPKAHEGAILAMLKPYLE